MNNYITGGLELKKVVAVLIAVLILAGCGSGEKSRPQDIREAIWEEGQQIAITINHNVEGGLKDKLQEFSHVSGTYSSYRHQSDVSESELKLIEALNELYYQSLFFGVFGKEVEDNEDYYKALTTVGEFYGREGLEYSKYDAAKLEPLLQTVTSDQLEREQEEEQNSPVEKFKRENQISLDSATVQYDMVNNLDKSFVISGVLELDDYFNYGFDDEGGFFSTYIIPDEGTYTDGWNLYFPRNDFEKLFNVLLEGEKHVLVEAMIPSYMYEEGQGKMARVDKASW